MTLKQRNVLIYLADAEKVGRQVTLDELVVVLGASQSKQAMQCTLRFLEGKLLLERSYHLAESRKKLVLSLTRQGFLLGSSLST